MSKRIIRWAYGVTTVPERFDDLLPQTLRSLAAAGFEEPRLFVDGESMTVGYSKQITNRWPRMQLLGNWVLGLWELLVRDPMADRYAMFQDDILAVRNLRQYLDACRYPARGYWNLYTFPVNAVLAKKPGWFASNQMGRGALGLVFDRDAVAHLLQVARVVRRPFAARQHKSIDGMVNEAMKYDMGRKEYCHSPSLVQHAGQYTSTVGKAVHPLAPDFPGEDFDAMELLGCTVH